MTLRSRWSSVRLLATALTLFGCSQDGGADRATREAAHAVEERVGGTFLDYYTDVLRLAQQYTSEPDSFRVALDLLPGSHLTPEEWEAWSAPYSQDSAPLAERLEKVIAEAGGAR